MSAQNTSALEPTKEVRGRLLAWVAAALEEHTQRLAPLPVAPAVAPDQVWGAPGELRRRRAAGRCTPPPRGTSGCTTPRLTDRLDEADQAVLADVQVVLSRLVAIAHDQPAGPAGGSTVRARGRRRT